MKCQKCNLKLRKVKVSIEGAKNKVSSSQCVNCNYFNLEEKLRSKTRGKYLTKLYTKDRLGIYLNKHIVESLNLRSVEEIHISVPDKNIYGHIFSIGEFILFSKISINSAHI